MDLQRLEASSSLLSHSSPSASPCSTNTNTNERPATTPVQTSASNYQTTGSPEHYAAAIAGYSERLPENFLCSGIHYRSLARFINPSPYRTSSADVPSSSTYDFVISTHLRDGARHESVGYDCNTGPEQYLANPHVTATSARLVFLRGYASPEWLRLLGADFRIDPEFFRQHLDFLNPKDNFDLPMVPSSSRNIIQLKITTICERRVAWRGRDVDILRRDDIRAVQRHHRELDSGGQPGSSIVRRFSVHNETMYTLEQRVSCCVNRKGSGWVAMIWLDIGKDLVEGSPAPWLDRSDPQSLRPNPCLPTIQHFPNVSLLSQSESPASTVPPRLPEASTRRQYSQSAKLLPTQYGSTLNPRVMQVDAMYALNELFTFATCSESQFINFMTAHIDDALRSSDMEEELSLASLRSSKSLLDDHITYMRELIARLECPVDPKWPRAIDKADITVATGAHDLLLKDCTCLLTRLQDLTIRCIDGTATIMNGAMLRESRNSISQGEKVKRLTILAILFVPTTFICSFFGMNFQEFGQGDLRLWVFAIPSVPAVLLSTAFCFWDYRPWK